MKRLANYILENSWTWAGTAMVLITLSGPTFKQALVITGVVVAVHLSISLTQGDST